MRRIRYWFFRQAIKETSINEQLERRVRDESIAYNLWVHSLSKSGFPKKDSGAAMDCWDLWDFYSRNKKRDICIKHAASQNYVVNKK
jgi:hypothetical protein